MTLRSRAQIEPRLLSQEQAATYCGVGIDLLKAECPVIPIKIRSKILYDRRALDRWIDDSAGRPNESQPGTDWLRRLDDADAHKGN